MVETFRIPSSSMQTTLTDFNIHCKVQTSIQLSRRVRRISLRSLEKSFKSSKYIQSMKCAVIRVGKRDGNNQQVKGVFQDKLALKSQSQTMNSGERLRTRCGIFVGFDPHHEEIAKNPQKHTPEGDPTQEG